MKLQDYVVAIFLFGLVVFIFHGTLVDMASTDNYNVNVDKNTTLYLKASEMTNITTDMETKLSKGSDVSVTTVWAFVSGAYDSVMLIFRLTGYTKDLIYEGGKMIGIHPMFLNVVFLMIMIMVFFEIISLVMKVQT